MARARELGIHVDVSTVLDLVRYDGRPVLKGRVFPSLSAVAERLCDDKLATKAVLASAGLPVPPAFGDRLVVKPRKGTHGEGVSLNLLPSQVEAASVGLGQVLVEGMCAGEDLRLQAVGGVLVAACQRQPPSIVGDGRSVAELVDEVRARVLSDNPTNALVVTGALPEVLDPGEVFVLNPTSNMSTGGRAVDVEPHPDWAELVQTVGRVLNISVFAVDAMTPDITRSWREAGAVLEVNARPEWMHHTFSAGRQHDLPRLLLEHLGA
jgi:D-alanine-D-alanine ligase-like ATP-grasp enzyme